MSTADSKPIDEMLEQLQTDAHGVAESAGGVGVATHSDVEAVESAAAAAGEIAGDIAAVENPVAPIAAPQESNSPAPSSPPSLEGAEPDGRPEDVHRLLAIEVPVIVQLGGRRMTIGEVMRFAVGSIVEISKAADDELELLVNNKAVGKGHAVKVGENFGVKITSIGSVKEVIRQLGGSV